MNLKVKLGRDCYIHLTMRAFRISYCNIFNNGELLKTNYEFLIDLRSNC